MIFLRPWFARRFQEVTGEIFFARSPRAGRAGLNARKSAGRKSPVPKGQVSDFIESFALQNFFAKIRRSWSACAKLALRYGGCGRGWPGRTPGHRRPRSMGAGVSVFLPPFTGEVRPKAGMGAVEASNGPPSSRALSRAIHFPRERGKKGESAAVNRRISGGRTGGITGKISDIMAQTPQEILPRRA
jgi:hypothetical protein